jgi:hypothetical protein
MCKTAQDTIDDVSNVCMQPEKCCKLDVAAESMLSFKATQQPKTANQGRLIVIASSPQTTGAATLDGETTASDSDATDQSRETQSAAAGAIQQLGAQQESPARVETGKLGQGHQPAKPATQQENPHVAALRLEASGPVREL